MSHASSGSRWVRWGVTWIEITNRRKTSIEPQRSVRSGKPGKPGKDGRFEKRG